MNYEDMITRVTRSLSASCGLTDYVESLILYKKEDTKSLIRDLCSKAEELGRKVNDLLFYSGWDSRDLEKLRNLTDMHWEALQELYRAFGQDEYNQYIIRLESCVNSNEWRKIAKESLERFLNGFSG